MTSSSAGSVVSAEGKPVFMQWRWYYSRPTLLLWITLLMLLIVPKENRNWQAWLILVVPLLALKLRLFHLMPDVGTSAGFDLFVQFIVTLAIAWASVWLAAPYITSGSWRQSFFLGVSTMLVVELLSYLGYFGFWSGSAAATASLMWCLTNIALLLSLGISGVCCRGRIHPGKVALWLLLWLPVVTFVSIGVLYTGTFLIQGELNLRILIVMIVPMLFMSAFGTALLYVMTAPVLLLAGLTDCYGKRFQSMLYRAPQEGPWGVNTLPDGNNPFGPEGSGEIETPSTIE